MTWSTSGSGIPDIPVNAIALDPLVPNRLWAGTDRGLWGDPGDGRLTPVGGPLPVVTGIASRLWMYPLMNLTYAVVDLILSPLSILVR